MSISCGENLMSAVLWHVKSADLPEMFFKKCCFQSDSKSNMADLQRHFFSRTNFYPMSFSSLFQLYCGMWSYQTCDNVPLVVLKKSCYFLEWFEIQDGLWMANTFFTSFPEKLYTKSPAFREMFLQKIQCLSSMAKTLFQLYPHIGWAINHLHPFIIFLKNSTWTKKITNFAKT